MDDRHFFFSLLACLTMACSSGFYAYTIVDGRTKPSRSSYWIWTFLSVLIVASYVVSGAENWQFTAVNAGWSLLIALLSLRYGEGTGLNPYDRAAIRIALASIPVWAALALVLPRAEAAFPMFCVQMIADAVACWPVFEKAWNRPETEDRRAWVVSVVAVGINVLAVQTWTLQDGILNGWIGGSALVVTLMLYLRPRSVATTLET